MTAAVPLTLYGTLSISEARLRPGSSIQPNVRTSVLDALRATNRLTVEADSVDDDADLAVDGREETAWSGRSESKAWTWTAWFVEPSHLGVIRARWGSAPTLGVPIAFRWEVLTPDAGDGRCHREAAHHNTWRLLPGAEQVSTGVVSLARPTRRSWFVDADACGLRLVITGTNAGPPVVREVRAIESARDVLREGVASDDGASPGFAAHDAIDGTYARRWVGSRGAGRWTLRVDLRDPAPIDRVRLVLGLDATSVARSPAGRSYGVAWSPIHYAVETSEDGIRFAAVASEPTRADGSIVPIRRRLVTLADTRGSPTLRNRHWTLRRAIGRGRGSSPSRATTHSSMPRYFRIASRRRSPSSAARTTGTMPPRQARTSCSRSAGTGTRCAALASVEWGSSRRPCGVA